MLYCTFSALCFSLHFLILSISVYESQCVPCKQASKQASPQRILVSNSVTTESLRYYRGRERGRLATSTSQTQARTHAHTTFFPLSLLLSFGGRVVFISPCSVSERRTVQCPRKPTSGPHFRCMAVSCVSALFVCHQEATIGSPIVRHTSLAAPMRHSPLLYSALCSARLLGQVTSHPRPALKASADRQPWPYAHARRLWRHEWPFRDPLGRARRCPQQTP